MKRYMTLKLALLTAALTLSLGACSKSEAPADPQQTATEAAAVVPTRPAQADPADWCGGHGLPESMCTKCNPELTEKFKAAGDWCAEHELPESVCPKCNPMDPPGAGAATGAGAAPVAAAARVGDPADWCGGHGLPESMCTKCNPELTEKFKAAGDWCAEHELPESACPKCNPMTPPGEGAAGAAAEHGSLDWCGEHGLPESKCAKCNPEIAAKFKAAGDWCAEHGHVESACPKCNPVEPPEGFAVAPFEAGTVVRLKSADHETLAGIASVKARIAPMGLGLQAPARVEFDQDRVAAVRSPVAGIVQEVLVDLGQWVEVGTPMFVLASADIGHLQAQIHSAREEVETAKANLARQKQLHADGIAAARKVELAHQEVEAARAGLTGIQSALGLAGSSGRSGQFTIRAPMAGAVVERPAVVGASADALAPLAMVADASAVWAIIDVPEHDANRVVLGQPVSLHIDGVEDAAVGTVTWISPAVDSRTRTVKVRAELSNADGRLRANQFGMAEIAVDGTRTSLVVPSRAIQRIDASSVVFVRKEKALYEPRVVEVTRESAELVQIDGPISAGEAVVTTGAFLLKTELKRDSIGAGCCEVE